MASSAIAFLAGLGTGYLNQTEKEKERERQAKLDQITFDKADRDTEQYKKDKADKANLAAAFKPATVNEQAATLDTSGKPVLYENADVAQSDFRQARRMAENGTPDAAPATINAPTPSFAAAGIPYTDKASAQAGADAYNKPEAQNQRVITALGGVDPIKALDLDHQQAQRGRETTKFTQEQTAYAKKLGDEGVFDGLKALSNGDGAGMVAAFNKSGQYKIDGQPMLTPVRKTVPGLGDIDTYDATFNVMGPDGKTTSQTVNSHDTRMKLMPFDKAYELGIKGKEADSKSALQANQGIYYSKIGDAAGVRAENSGTGGVNGLLRIPEIDKITLGNLNKEHEKLGADLTKAQGDPMYDAAKPSASVQSMKTRMAANQAERDAITARHAGEPAASDGLGIRAAVAKPTTKSAAPAAGSAKDGQIQILNQEWEAAHVELNAAKTPEARVRSQGDITALSREFANLKRQPPYATPAILSGASTGAPAAAAATPVIAARAQAVAAPATATAAATGQKPVSNLASALGANTGNATLDQIVLQKMPALQAAGAEIQQMKESLAAVAKSGDVNALRMYSEKLSQSRAKLDDALKEMSPKQAEQVRLSVGY